MENKVEITLFYAPFPNPDDTANLAWLKCDGRDRYDRQDF